MTFKKKTEIYLLQKSSSNPFSQFKSISQNMTGKETFIEDVHVQGISCKQYHRQSPNKIILDVFS